MPPRTPSDYRVYDDAALDRLRFIRGAQRLGLRLRDIRDLLAVRDTGVCPCEPAEGLLNRRLAELDAEMARLGTLRGQMVAMLAALPSQDCPPTNARRLVCHHREEVTPVTIIRSCDCDPECTDPSWPCGC